MQSFSQIGTRFEIPHLLAFGICKGSKAISKTKCFRSLGGDSLPSISFSKSMRMARKMPTISNAPVEAAQSPRFLLPAEGRQESRPGRQRQHPPRHSKFLIVRSLLWMEHTADDGTSEGGGMSLELAARAPEAPEAPSAAAMSSSTKTRTRLPTMGSKTATLWQM